MLCIVLMWVVIIQMMGEDLAFALSCALRDTESIGRKMQAYFHTVSLIRIDRDNEIANWQFFPLTMRCCGGDLLPE